MRARDIHYDVEEIGGAQECDQDIAHRNLFASVLERAVTDYCGRPGASMRKPRARREAAAWFRSNITRPLSFLWLCSALDIDPKVIRAYLREMDGTPIQPSVPLPYRKSQRHYVGRKAAHGPDQIGSL